MWGWARNKYKWGSSCSCLDLSFASVWCNDCRGLTTRRTDGKGNVLNGGCFFQPNSSLTSDILMTILPSYLIDAPNLLYIFLLYLLSWCFWHSVLGSVGNIPSPKAPNLPEVIEAALERGLRWLLRIYENSGALVSYHCHPSLPLGNWRTGWMLYEKRLGL